MLRSLLPSLAASLLLSSPAAALGFSHLYVFGDSLVDVGNTQATALALGAPDPTPSSLGYFDGRFTNGVHAADVVNSAIGSGSLSHSLDGGDDYAFGGARARDNSPADPLPDLVLQVGAFGVATLGSADPDALYLINAGGNDVFDILEGADAAQTLEDAVAAITSSVSVLQDLGARHILFVGVGDVGATPEAIAAGQSAAGRALSLQLNDAIRAELPADVVFFDTIGLFDRVVADPAAFGLPAGIDFTTACLDAGASPPAGAPECSAYAFFDSVHPTSPLLQILGDELVAAVPEPGTALLLAIGLTGLAARRRAA